MKKYNHTLDYAALALASAANGDLVSAGKLLVKASQQHDVKAAVQILEASNAQAFEALTAANKAAVKAAKAAKATPGKIKAGERVKAATKPAPTKVKAFDIGDESEINDLIEEDTLPQGSDSEEVDAADEDMDDEDGDFDAQFASMLDGMKGAAKAK